MSTELTIIQKVRGELDKRENEFRALLPRHISPGQFIRVAQTAMIQNEELQQCTQKSLVIACTKAAETGLMPDGEEGVIVAYNVKVSKRNEPDRWEKQAKFLPMVRGIRKQVLQSGVCKDWKVRIVREADSFEHIDGDVESITHRPSYDDDSPITHVYSIAYLDNGEINRHVMSMKTVEKIRKKSRSADRGPWVDWLEEMTKKTCLKQHAKALPRARDDIAQQRFMGALRALDDAEGVIEAQPQRQLLQAPIDMHQAASKRLADVVDQTQYDPETGEIDSPAPAATKKPRAPRKTANERLAEAEGRTLAPPAQESPKPATNGKVLDADPASDVEYKQEAIEDPTPAGFRDDVEASERGGDEPDVAAFRDGWNSRFASKTRVPPHHLDHRDLVQAWMNGYDAAQKTVDIGNTPGTPQASKIMCDNLISRMFV